MLETEDEALCRKESNRLSRKKKRVLETEDKALSSDLNLNNFQTRRLPYINPAKLLWFEIASLHLDLL